MLISFRFDTKVQKESDVRKGKRRYEGDTSDHIHICVSILSKLSVSEFVGYLNRANLKPQLKVLVVTKKDP